MGDLQWFIATDIKLYIDSFSHFTFGAFGLRDDMKEILGLNNDKCFTDFVLHSFHCKPHFCLPLLFTRNTIRERNVH